MNTKSRLLKVTLFIGVQTLLFAFNSYCQANRLGPGLARPAPVPRVSPLEERYIANLKKESLDESMDRLISDELQAVGYAVVSGLISQHDLDFMLEGRRSLKVLQTIEKLPEKDREVKCKQLFSKALRAYTNAFYTYWQHAVDPSSTTNRPPLLAPKEALCAAMFITADIGRRDLLSGQFTQLDQMRSEIEPGLLAISTSLLSDPQQRAKALMWIDYLVPDSGFQINVLRLAAASGVAGDAGILEQVDAECRLARMKAHKITVRAWDAGPTWIDFSPGAIPTNTSMGISKYLAYKWESDVPAPDNDQQEKVVLKLRSIVLH